MKKLFIILTVVFSIKTTIAQWSVQPSFGISYSYSMFGSYNTEKASSYTEIDDYNRWYYRSGTPYQMISILGGMVLSNKGYSLDVKLLYQYFLCGRKQMKNNLIGFAIKNRFREHKITRPFVGLEFSTEVITNYKDKLLGGKDYYPVDYSNSTSLDPTWREQINYYQATPFIGNLLVGCDFRLYKGLSVNVAFGYGLRILKTQYGILAPNVEHKIINQKIGNPYTLGFNMFVLQTGLNYDIPVKKKEKTEVP